MTAKGSKRNVVWKDNFYLEIYILATQGLTIKEIAATLGTTPQLMNVWMRRRPAVVEAFDKGSARHHEIKGDGNDANSFKNYIYRQLPPKLRSLWEQMKELDLKKRFKKKKYLLKMETEEVRKHLFMYAMCATNFNVSKACKRVSISHLEFERWIKEDDFKQLLEQIEFHKKNFFEEALVKKVKAGDTGAILFVNRTKNRDRGYGDKFEMEFKGKIEHQHTHLVKIDDLPLSLDLKKQILNALRQQEDSLRVHKKDDPKALEYKVVHGNKAVPVESEEESDE